EWKSVRWHVATDVCPFSWVLVLISLRPFVKIKRAALASSKRGPRKNYTVLFLARVIDLHCFRFLALTIFIPLHRHVVLVVELYDLANFLLHPWNRFDFAGVGKRFRSRIVITFRHHDAGAHIIHPSADKFLL